MEQCISGTTTLLCLFGSPVGHSGSPAMYNFSFRHDGIDCAYLCFDVKEEEMEDSVKAARLFHMRGFNLTMPCKTITAKLVDELSPAARIVGAVNTVVNEGGRLIGYMTDGAGFVRNLRENGVDVKGKNLVVAGAGGAATAIQVECALSGAAGISVFNRQSPSFERALSTAEKLKAEAPACAVKVMDLEDKEAFQAEIAAADILVNATSVGMKPGEDGTIVEDTGVFRPDLVVADIVYNPRKTRLMREAKAFGCEKVIGGEGMLLWQGAVNYKLFTGLDMPVDEYRRYQNAHR